jgi:hypothetical protein
MVCEGEMKHAIEIFAYTMLTIIMAGTTGYHIAMREKGPRCPSVAGAKPAVTIDSADEQRCIYVQDLEVWQKRLSVRL